MLGIITHVYSVLGRATLRAEDGHTRSFRRVAMILWLQFDALKPGDVVRFELAGKRSAVINVEIDRRPA